VAGQAPNCRAAKRERRVLAVGAAVSHPGRFSPLSGAVVTVAILGLKTHGVTLSRANLKSMGG
jgi:hypothetical protein